MHWKASAGGKETVIVPAFNEAAKILEVLKPLPEWQGRKPGRRQVVVVNDGSTDNTAAVVKRFFEDGFPGGVLIDSDPAGKKNLGKAEAVIAGTGIYTCTGFTGSRRQRSKSARKFPRKHWRICAQ